jgi:anti-sigma factor RsiW
MLSDYSLGLVAPRDREAIQAHLSGCNDCRRRLSQLQSLDGLLSARRLEAPEALVERVMAQARAERLPSAPLWIQLVDGVAPLLGYTMAASLACVVAWLVAAQWMQRPPAFLAPLNGLPASEVTAIGVVGLGAVAGAAAWLASRGAEAAV